MVNPSTTSGSGQVEKQAPLAQAEPLDALTMAVLSSRVRAIVREMTTTLLRAGRSAVITVARDFSCAVVTAEDEILETAEGLPGHVFGSHLQTRSMRELHPDIAEGDAFLHNDPHLGGTHHADHTILVPIFVDGEHLFTSCAKAHQADCGNSKATTYMPFARDIYEEGALSFPCVRVQKDYKDVDDIIRMCRRRIRVPDQWYGDYLATLGAARVAERRLKALVERYGRDVIVTFIKEWFDYSERRMIEAIEQLPEGSFIGEGRYDSLPGLPDGIPVKAKVDIDPKAAKVSVDLRDNIDCVPAGLNLCEATSTSYAYTGVFNGLNEDVPYNHGSFRRIDVMLRENCVVGIPVHPTSCSMATDNLADRLINAIQAAFAELAEGRGLAEGGIGVGPAGAVVSGKDPGRDGAAFVNQILLTSNGGPGTPQCDGWINYLFPCCAGLVYRDSIEVDEQKFPVLIRSLRLDCDSGGPGRMRGAPGTRVAYTPHGGPFEVAYPMDGWETPAKGVRGGREGRLTEALLIREDGQTERLPNFAFELINPGETVVGVASGGGGYGHPFSREPERVRHDVLEGFVSLDAARDDYGVVLVGDIADESLTVDQQATEALRESARQSD